MEIDIPVKEVKEIDVKVDSVRSLCKLRDSQRLNYILEQIDVFSQKPRKTSEMIGNLESDPEYQLIVEANNIAVEIDEEICKYIFSLKVGLNFILNSVFQQPSTSSQKKSIKRDFPSWIRSLFLKWTTYEQSKSFVMIWIRPKTMIFFSKSSPKPQL